MRRGEDAGAALFRAGGGDRSAEEESSLEKSFQLYHRGMDMLKACSDRIDRVEKQIQALDEKGEAHELQ